MRPSRRVVQTLLDPGDPVDPRVDLIELRLDLYPGIDAPAFIRRSSKAVIATVRRESDGGRWVGPEDKRRKLLESAKDAAFVDVELDVAADIAIEGPRRIVSHHDCVGMPADLDSIFERSLLAGADVVKIAATPASAREAFRLLELPTPGIGMGEFGRFTRALAPLTYCCATRAVAPGMPTPDELLDVFRVHRLGPAPSLFGVAGDPIAQSRSPAIHNPALERDGIDAVYLRFLVRDLADFWPTFVAHGGRGLSITAPLKIQAAALATRPSEEVRECGAANTLLADGSAHNTDVLAFLDLIPPGRGEALVLGAGGAARAAVAALSKLGYQVKVWARRADRAAALGAESVGALRSAPVLVNTTPLEPPPGPFVVDLRYGEGIAPPRRGVDGLAFLRAQARHQYKLFTGGNLG
ncbi:MAG: type I 3-dehydroquinate dehydratase [Planctomycetota bacterium]|jgi:3-dehydroquinate dehydratase/shikimate dehydrogenase